jgi:SAM-dependent methyltransferase
VVRERYSRIATDSASCCGETRSSCSEDGETAKRLGYTDEQLDAVAGTAGPNLGCGNPISIASLDAGDDVLDLGSGGGFDCFLAARDVGADGHVIGVDMTPEMIERARENVESDDVSNVEFRLGEIEHLPVADESVDVVISNCVINLSPDPPQVFREAARVLRPGGRLAISDVVLTTTLPPAVHSDGDSIGACVAGASSVADIRDAVAGAGFSDVSVEPTDDSEAVIREWDPDRDLSEYIVAARICAEKPTD